MYSLGVFFLGFGGESCALVCHIGDVASGSGVFSFDVDAEEILNIAFHRDVQSCLLDVRNCLVDVILIWSCQNRIVSIKDINYIPSIKDTFVNVRLFEIDLVDKTIDEIFIPNSPGLFDRSHCYVV